MKRIAIAVASVFTAAAAPFASAQGVYDNNVYDSRDRRTFEATQQHDDYRDRQWSRGRGDFARVLETRPLYDAANSREECWNPRAGHFEEVRRNERSGGSVGKGTVLGAIVGGVIGHQFDHGTGTGVGAVLGGVAGNQYDRRENRDERTQNDLDYSRCRVAGSGPVQGYDVRYEYRGREYVARMDREPGNRLRVGEDIRHDGTPHNVSQHSTR